MPEGKAGSANKLLLTAAIIFAIIAPYRCVNSSNTNTAYTEGDDLDWRESNNLSPDRTETYQIQEELAKVNCRACHDYVPPEMLDRITWPRVLSVMQNEMNKRGFIVKENEWIEIQKFYLEQAPKVFHSQGKENLPSLQNLFRESANKVNTSLSDYTLLKFVAADSTVYLGRENGQILEIRNNEIVDKFSISNIPIDIHSGDNHHLVLGIGHLAPSEEKRGQLIRVSSDSGQSVIIDSLHRPVQFQAVNSQPNPEYIIASFGSNQAFPPSGGLSLYNFESAHEIVIDSLPGATQSELIDLDHDGQIELVALFSQANETINFYKNPTEGTYELYKSLNFSPVFGTNSFQLEDFNKDGFWDLIVTNGDNDDYSQIFKPYHGVRIYQNDQSNNFEPVYFYHINGASKVKSADLDRDGDVDFIVLAMYPDLFSRPWESLLYFENNGQNKFKVQYFEERAAAKWLLLELADIDSDGDLDIIIAANDKIEGLLPPEIKEDWSKNRIGVKIYYNTLYKAI